METNDKKNNETDQIHITIFHGELPSTTFLDVLNSANAAEIGGEIIRIHLPKPPASTVITAK